MENKSGKTVERHIQWGPYYLTVVVPVAEKLDREKVAFTLSICAIAVGKSTHLKVLPPIQGQKLQRYYSRASHLGGVQFLEKMVESGSIYPVTKIGIQYRSSEEYRMTLLQEGKLDHTTMTPAEKALILS